MQPHPKIPVTVLVVTKNASAALRQCLEALHGFSEVIVVDSQSTDATKAIAQDAGIPVLDFQWNGRYPKKRQWCLEHVTTKYDWIFFVDADEIVTEELAQEISHIITAPKHAAYFVYGQPHFGGRLLRFGRWNNKIALFDKRQVHYPEIDDAQIDALGEIEGHYQPIVRGSIGQLHRALQHYCALSPPEWRTRHQRYAIWQAAVEAKHINLAAHERGLRYFMKSLFQFGAVRPVLAFIDSYVLKLGFLDGTAGFRYAAGRFWYYRLISGLRRAGASTISETSGGN